MPKLPIVSGKDVIKALQKIGFSLSGQKGSHIKWNGHLTQGSKL